MGNNNTLNGVWLWLKHRWFIIPTVIVLCGVLVGYGQHEANQDSSIARNREEYKLAEKERGELKTAMDTLLQNDKTQMEFYRLLRPDLWAQAVENANHAAPADSTE